MLINTFMFKNVIKMKINKRILNILLLFILINLYSCFLYDKSCSYKIIKDYIRSNCDMHNGVNIAKLDSVKFDSNGIPVKYNRVFDAWFGTIKDFNYNLTKINFKEKINGYRWHFIGNATFYDTIPFNFEKENWYSFMVLN
jgi:hypothetical protein